MTTIGQLLVLICNCKNKGFYYWILVFNPIVLGILVYIFFREDVFLYNKIFQFFNFDNVIENIKVGTFIKQLSLPNWIKYSLPDGLYMFSISNYFLILNSNKTGILIGFLFFIASILIEILQLIFGQYFLWLGTYDILDILFYVIGYTVSLILFKKNRKYNFYSKLHRE